MTKETAAFDRMGSSRLPSIHKGHRHIIDTLMIFTLLASAAYWWFGPR
jgi:hypothetical protein